VRSTTLVLQARLDAGNSAIDELRSRLDDARTSHDELRARFGAIARPSLDETLEIRGQPLAGLAKEKVGLPADTSIGSLAPHVRYTLFESVFYDSAAVAAKQRVYLRYIDGDLFSRLPFLDLGCGRGEFLHILRERGIECVGVDQNPACVAPLQAAGFDAVEQDLLAFLESDRRTYSGCSLLQVAEHLTSDQLERALALIAGRLAPGALLIVETPNPLSLFALSVFHTDPTHVAPLPPERLRYSIEAAGFHQALTLFQARIPEREFAGPDPRGYYGDYAIIARRSFEREQRQDDTAGGAR
jgi:O-antigen chain-terminating methyltransferase